MRAPGSNVTIVPAARAGGVAWNNGSSRTDPVNQSAGPSRERCVPIRLISTIELCQGERPVAMARTVSECTLQGHILPKGRALISFLDDGGPPGRTARRTRRSRRISHSSYRLSVKNRADETANSIRNQVDDALARAGRDLADGAAEPTGNIATHLFQTFGSTCNNLTDAGGRR